jgi:hypothetical protein
MAIYRGHSLPSLADLKLPVDGYIRVSRVGDRGGESYISPDLQREAIESWARGQRCSRSVHSPGVAQVRGVRPSASVGGTR